MDRSCTSVTGWLQRHDIDAPSTKKTRLGSTFTLSLATKNGACKRSERVAQYEQPSSESLVARDAPFELQGTWQGVGRAGSEVGVAPGRELALSHAYSPFRRRNLVCSAFAAILRRCMSITRHFSNSSW